MNGTPILFAEIRRRTDQDIVGGTVEVSLGQNVYRGYTDDITWWNNYPHEIFILDTELWDPKLEKWSPSRVNEIIFPFDKCEHFIGPFEADSGEIFFMTDSSENVTLYPIGCTCPDLPKDDLFYRQIRSSIQRAY